MKLSALLAASCGLVALVSVSAGAQSTFTFSSDPVGSYPFEQFSPPPTTISYGPATLTAEQNASSPALTALFGVTNATYTPNQVNTLLPTSYQFLDNFNGGTSPYGDNLSGTILANVDGISDDVLTIDFSRPITSISLDFAFNNGSPDNTLTLGNGINTPDSSTGTLGPTSGDEEGSLSLSNAAGFSDVSLVVTGSSSAFAGYAIDNIVVTPVPAPTVPEPGIVGLALASLVPAVSLLRRRRK